jgi:hypothetical protein
MPTPYPGVSTATQPPSGAPEPEGSPTLNLPADGDPPNASTYIQAYKALADWVAYALKPKSKASDWVKALMRWRSAAGHTRSYVDHLGFLNGRVVQWDEAWGYFGSTLGTFGPQGIGGPVAKPFDATGNPLAWFSLQAVAQALINAGAAANLAAVQVALNMAGLDLLAAFTNGWGAPAPTLLGADWIMKGIQDPAGLTGSTLINFSGPTADNLRHRYVGLTAGDSAGDCAVIWRRGHSYYDNDLAFALDWEMRVSAVNIPNRFVYCGFSVEDALPPSVAQHFAVFSLGPSGNWTAFWRGGGATTTVDTTVAAAVGVWTRFRIEFHGGNVADDGVRAIRFYINGALVATGTTDLPGTTAYSAPHFSLVDPLGGADGFTAPLRLGPARFRSNIYGSDVI